MDNPRECDYDPNMSTQPRTPTTRMTVEEFLAWAEGRPGRHELGSRRGYRAGGGAGRACGKVKLATHVALLAAVRSEGASLSRRAGRFRGRSKSSAAASETRIIRSRAPKDAAIPPWSPSFPSRLSRLRTGWLFSCAGILKAPLIFGDIRSFEKRPALQGLNRLGDDVRHVLPSARGDSLSRVSTAASSSIGGGRWSYAKPRSRDPSIVEATHPAST